MMNRLKFAGSAEERRTRDRTTLGSGKKSYEALKQRGETMRNGALQYVDNAWRCDNEVSI